MRSSGPGKGLVCVFPLVRGQWAARSSAENRNYFKNYDTEIPIRYRYTGIPPGKRYRKSYRSVNDNLTAGGATVEILKKEESPVPGPPPSSRRVKYD